MPALLRTVLIAAYAVLFIAATGRSSIQLATKASEAPLPYALSAAAAVLYGLIAVALWRGGRAWRRVATVAVAVELVGVLAVGTWGLVDPSAWPDATVWTDYGIGYGWTPVILPAVALVSLVRARRGRHQAPDPVG